MSKRKREQGKTEAVKIDERLQSMEMLVKSVSNGLNPPANAKTDKKKVAHFLTQVLVPKTYAEIDLLVYALKNHTGPQDAALEKLKEQCCVHLETTCKAKILNFLHKCYDHSVNNEEIPMEDQETLRDMYRILDHSALVKKHSETGFIQQDGLWVFMVNNGIKKLK